jgi:DNA replication protein DnaC
VDAAGGGQAATLKYSSRRDAPTHIRIGPAPEPACGEEGGGLGVRACLAGQRVLFRTATEWVAHLADAQRQDKLDQELDRLERIPLLVCDEVGYIPFDPQAASLMFMLVSRRCERASMIVTSNKPFSAWGEIFGDDMAATAMIDRLIHHSEILSLKGDSYRLKDRDLGPRPARPRDTT